MKGKIALACIALLSVSPVWAKPFVPKPAATMDGLIYGGFEVKGTNYINDDGARKTHFYLQKGPEFYLCIWDMKKSEKTTCALLDE